MRTLAVFLAILLLRLPADGVAVAQSSALRGPEVEDVRLEGVRALDERLVRAAIVTRETRCRSPLLAVPCLVGLGERAAFLDTAEVRRDAARIDSLYGAWGYPAAEVASEVTPLADGDVAVLFRVTEGAPLLVRSVEVRGVPAGLEVGALPLRSGEPYALARLEETQRRILAALSEEGYAFAQLEVSGDVAPDQTGADVVLDVIPGAPAVFGPAEIRAQEPLDEEIVRDRLAFRVGDPFRPEALLRTAERLYDLPVVEQVSIAPAASAPGDSAVRTVVTVTRGRLTAVQADFVVSSSSCLGGTFGVATRHLFGAPRVASVSVGGSNVGAGEVCAAEEGEAFEEPAWFARASLREPVAPQTWLLLDAQVSREAVTRAYVRQGARGRAALSGPLGRAWTAEGGYAYDRSENEAAGAFVCVLYGRCLAAEVAGATDATTVSPVELALAWQPPEARRTRLGPVPAESASVLPAAPRWTYGARASLAGATGLTGSEVTYARATLDASAARRFGPRAELAARARLGALADGGEILPPQLRLFGGGPLGVRGVAPNLLGPRFLLVRDDAADEIGCVIAAGACEGVEVDPEQVRVRALGGEALLETSLEARLWVSSRIQLAAFVDAGAVWSGEEGVAAEVPRSEAIVTPGVGALVLSPFGPVRLDVAYNPSPARRLPLLAADPDDEDGFIVLGDAVFDPYDSFRRRLQLQLSLGQTF